MNVERIRRALRAAPFEPFLLRTSDGREYPVKHPEFLAIMPSGRAVIVTHSEDLWDVLDLLHISSLRFGNGRSSRSQLKRSK